jgi:poly-gamma-glutamate synthesis protein (capsule biosynthesis protein)
MSPAAERTLFLCGDVMTGRGIDQILAHPSSPGLYEPMVRSALEYVEMAEAVHGPIPRGAAPEYVWGDALDAIARARPDARIVNLETSITTSRQVEPKGINYRMHPANVAVLGAARIDCCALANNHVLDWGPAGLLETLDTLGASGIRCAGAGRTLADARAPALLPFADSGRVLVFAFASVDSGVGRSWAAGEARPGIHLLRDLSDAGVDDVAALVAAVKRAGDLAVASVHWGYNWGYDIPAEQTRFARALVDRARIDLVHGHSSHHPRAIEVYRERAILYGCGDFLNDYEGIGGREEYRGDLALAYFPTLDAASGRLVRLTLAPLEIRRFRLRHASADDRAWLRDTLDREARRFGHGVALRDGRLELDWRTSGSR